MSQTTLVHRILAGFHPEEHNLSRQFVLTNLTEMKGCGCKVPQVVLQELLKTFGNDVVIDHDGVGIGLDSCVIPLRHKGLNLVQTTDFFYPLVEDPYIMGRITVANVLSDLYAMGVVNCDNLLMLLGVALKLDEAERDVIVREFIQGFKDGADLADTKVRGGQTVRCPWLLLGGVASSVASDEELIKVNRAEPGDVLVLTKPLGGQIAVNTYEWIIKQDKRIEEFDLDKGKIIKAYQQTCEQMARLNRNAAKLLHKYEAHASTDVTGFGILGHARNLVKAQEKNIDFVFDQIPTIDYMIEASKKMVAAGKPGFNFFKGLSAETSGGLLVALKADKAQGFIDELEQLDGHPAWIVGRVETGKNEANFSDNVQFFDVVSRIH